MYSQIEFSINGRSNLETSRIVHIYAMKQSKNKPEYVRAERQKNNEHIFPFKRGNREEK